MKSGITSNGIEYYCWLDSEKEHHRFELYPITNKHSEMDVSNAKKWIYDNAHVKSLQIRWKLEGDNTPMPEKIPDYLIIKSLNSKIGQLESYIQELEEQLKEKDNLKITNKDRAEVHKDIVYKEQQAKIKILEKTICILRKDKQDLIIRLVQSKSS